MNLHLHVCHPRFGFDLAADLEAKKVGTVTVTTGRIEHFVLNYRASVPLREVAGLLEALAPLVPEVVCAVPELDAGYDAILWLGEPGGLHERTVQIYSDSTECAEQMHGLLAAAGLRPRVAGVQVVHEDVLVSSGVPRFAQQMVCWQLLRKDVQVQVREDAAYAGLFGLWVRDPVLAKKLACERYPVEVDCDDAELGSGLLDLLAKAGFACQPLVVLSAHEALAKSFLLQPGPFQADRRPAEFARLQGVLHDYLNAQHVDVLRFPVQLDTIYSGVVARIVAPLGVCRDGRKSAYAGPHPERFQLTLVTDDAAGVEDLRRRLLDKDFRTVDVQVRPSLVDKVDDGSAGEFLPGFAVAWNEAGRHPVVAGLIRAAVQTEMDRAGAGDFVLRQVDSCGGDSTSVRIYFPHRGIADGALMARVADPRRTYFRLCTTTPDGWKDLAKELRGWGFLSFEVASEVGDPVIYYGAASPELLERLRRTISDHDGPYLPLNKCWGDTEFNITVYLPARTSTVGSGSGGDGQADAGRLPEEMATQLEVWAFGEAGSDTVESFVEVAAERVRVGGVWLPRHPGQRHVLAPHPSAFGHFCLDRLTAATLEHVATSVLLREPSLLEGETSTSKTSSILYLAALLNQPVARINLNGQTDTGELIGRFVPQHLILELPLSDQELYAAADLLEAETRMILDKARRENRQLSRLEIQQIMAHEEMVSHPWRWEDGLVPQAMRKGWWVLLDEVNLAEPQILERLNSVLEHDPSLVLTENDNTVIGGGGTPVHADFRIFATMNPAEYAGRSVLSPAYRDRWRGYRFVPRPGEEEYLAMLRLLIYGEQPDFSLSGRTYLGAAQEPRYHHVTALAQADEFLEALARFHAALESAVGQSADTLARIGSRRRERYIFTRRGILSMLEYLSSPLYQEDGQLSSAALRRALLRYYLGRVATAEDRGMVVQLLDAHGLGPNTWTLGDTGPMTR